MSLFLKVEGWQTDAPGVVVLLLTGSCFFSRFSHLASQSARRCEYAI